MKRFLAMLLASVLAVGIIAFATNGEGRRTDGLYYEVTGIRPDAQIMTSTAKRSRRRSICTGCRRSATSWPRTIPAWTSTPSIPTA